MQTSKYFIENFLGKRVETIVDIGANDGSWLQLFRENGSDVFGIEPSPRHSANLSKLGIANYEGYFEKDATQSVTEWLGNRKLDVITINNTFANMNDLHKTLSLIKGLAQKETIVSIVSGYHFEQFAAGMYDYVYHEHLSYFSVKDLMFLAREHGFSDATVRTFPLKGGSIQFIFSKREPNPFQLAEIEKREQIEKWVIESPEMYAQKINYDMEIRLKKINSVVENLVKKNDRTVVGYGYAHSSATLMYMAGIQEKIGRLVDDNKSRWGLFTPGTGLEISSPQTISVENESVLILAWQHERIIEERIRSMNHKIVFSNPLGSLSRNL
jgi:hypothetical protein